MYLASKWISEKFQTAFKDLKVSQFQIASIFMNLVLLSTCTFLYLEIKETKQMTVQKTDQLYEIVDYYQCNVDSLTSLSYKEHKTSSNNKPKDVKSSQSTKSRKSSILSFENFRVASNVDRYLHESLCSALKSYTGPGSALITSMRRKHCKHSKHSTGEAIDINMDKNGRNMLKWLITDSGQQWLVEHELSFYVEDKPKSRRLDEFRETYSDYIFENRGATGLHIHMYKL
jgi:hypothetical protein